jgi:predicted nucleotidyltransferase
MEPLANAFLTGSQVYGAPTEESDVDVVILTDKDTERRLIELSKASGMDGYQIRFGKVNLIPLTSFDDFEKWKLATDACTARRPVSRDEAVRLHKLVMGR